MTGDNQLDDLNIEGEDGDSLGENDFLHLFCKRFGCGEENFERQLLLECVYPESLGLARLIRLFYPGFFRLDFDLIDQIKHVTSLEEFQKLVDFHDVQNAPDGLFRLILKVRMSKQRLQRIAQKLFYKNSASEPAPAVRLSPLKST